ncbi:MarR family winged helix-turn-helix transcriptional regulator [Marisediminicola sp. LYQ134]|uniref:MarR family winged helix-turn-helix transcriptional regulator n=1 Tax=unclassified Marisediminicola TaxID=2618316 RepID=UPI0039835A89
MTDKRIAVAAWEALFRSQVSVMRHLHAEFPSDQLSLTEYDVLFNLSKHEGHELRMKDLNHYLLLTQPSVSRLIDRLVTRGLVVKRLDPRDARGVIVTLTDEGYDLFRRVAVKHMDSIVSRVGSALSDTELVQLAELTDKLRNAGRE